MLSDLNKWAYALSVQRFEIILGFDKRESVFLPAAANYSAGRNNLHLELCEISSYIRISKSQNRMHLMYLSLQRHTIGYECLLDLCSE